MPIRSTVTALRAICALCSLQRTHATWTTSDSRSHRFKRLCIGLQVKELLESGQTLHKPLFNSLLERFASFIHSVGITKPNIYLLPVFTFVQRCCGVSDTALEQLLIKHRLDQMIFGSGNDNREGKSVSPLIQRYRFSTDRRPPRSASKRKE